MKHRSIMSDTSKTNSERIQLSITLEHDGKCYIVGRETGESTVVKLAERLHRRYYLLVSYLILFRHLQTASFERRAGSKEK